MDYKITGYRARKSYFISLKRSVRSQEVREMKKESVIIL